MQVTSQRAHDRNLGRFGADNGRHKLGGVVVDVQEGLQLGVRVRGEVALDGFGAPLGEEGGDVLGGEFGLEAEGVAAEVDAGVGGVGWDIEVGDGCGFQVGFGGDDELVAQVAKGIRSVE